MKLFDVRKELKKGYERHETSTVQVLDIRDNSLICLNIMTEYSRAMCNKLVKLYTCIRDRGIFVQCDQRRVEQYRVHVFVDDTMVGCLDPRFVLIHYNGEREKKQKKDHFNSELNVFPSFNKHLLNRNKKHRVRIFSFSYFSCKE